MPQDTPQHRHKQITDYGSVSYIMLLSKKWRAREVIFRFTTALLHQRQQDCHSCELKKEGGVENLKVGSPN